MKTLYSLLISSLLLVSLNSKAQYTPLVVDSAHWIVGICDSHVLPPTSYAWEYYILGDTIVNTVQYKKVYKRSWTSILCTLDRPYNSYSLFSLIREDTLARKVYSTGGGYACPSGPDTVLYDFNLQIGDTFKSCLTDYMGGVVIGGISLNSSFWLSSTTYHSTEGELYEGVGSNFGLFEHLGYNVSGAADPGLSYYCRGNLASCGLPTNIKKYESIRNVTISPNPISQHQNIKIKVFNTKNIKLKVYDLLGENYNLNYKVVNKNELEVESSFLHNGVYLFIVEDGNSVLTKQKVIVLK